VLELTIEPVVIVDQARKPIESEQVGGVLNCLASATCQASELMFKELNALPSCGKSLI
jgi:hypothetical protein